MNTPSHWLMTVAAGKLGPWAGKCPRWALGLGSVAPDLPLYGLSFGGIWYFSQVKGWEMKQVAEHLFKNLYYNDPVWIGLHNFFHSPTMILLIAVIVWTLRDSFPKFARWMYFFLAACLFHSVVDIVTHFDDGPVLFFPFDWKYRFSSPISYWDPNHYGIPFMIFEGILNVCLSVFLIRGWWKSRKPPAPQADVRDISVQDL